MTRRTRLSLAPSARRSRVSTRALIIRATLTHVTPVIWREIRVPEHYALAQLHRVLQLAFGWLDCHLYSFIVGRMQYADPRAEIGALDATRVTLADLALTAKAKLTYLYDFGDDWKHALVVQRVVDRLPDDGALPALLGGARSGPPEDSGGPHGYEQLLAARSDPTHPEHDDAVSWIGLSFDPDVFDLRSSANARTKAAARGAI